MIIQTVALTVLMPITGALPTAPAHLPGPSLPMSINQSIRLPGPTLPVMIDGRAGLPGPVVPVARIQLDIPQSVSKQAPSAIDTLRKMVKDDRPLIVKAAFDNVTLPESDLMDEIGVTPVRVGR